MGAPLRSTIRRSGCLALALASVFAVLGAAAPAPATAELTRCGSLIQAPSIHGRWVKVTGITVVEGDASCRLVRGVIRAYASGRGLHVAGALESWRVKSDWICSSGSSHAGCRNPSRGVEIQVLWRFPNRAADERTCTGSGPHFGVSSVGCGQARKVIAAALPGIQRSRKSRVRVNGARWRCRAVRSTASDFLPVICWTADRRQIGFDLDGPVSAGLQV